MVRRVRKVFGALLLAAVTILALPGQPALSALNVATDGCGTERWHVKTLDDPTAPYVHLNPTHATVAQLRSTAAPSGFSDRNDASRYDPTERQAYRVRVLLVGWKLEADRDFHVVIADADAPAKTMVAEVPDPACAAARASGYAAKFAAVRAVFVACFGTPERRYRAFPAKTMAVLDGVGFFDVDHGQTGRARLAPAKVDIELHPILRVETSGKCRK